MNQLKYFLFAFSLFSCKNDSHKIILPQFEPEIEIENESPKRELKNLKHEEIEEILKLENDPDEMYLQLTGNYGCVDPGFILKKSEINFDDDNEKEFVLEFTPLDESCFLAVIFVIDNKKRKYSVGEPIYLDRDYDSDLQIETVNKVLLYKSRVNGTCDEGTKIVGYQLIDGKLKQSVDLFDYHQGNSCSSYEDEDTGNRDYEYYSTTTFENEFVSKDTIIGNGILNYWIHEQVMDMKKEDIYLNKKIKLIYVFDENEKKFVCYNNNGEKLFDYGSAGLSFELVALVKKGML